MPSAFGALDFLDVNARTMSVAKNGSILYKYGLKHAELSLSCLRAKIPSPFISIESNVADIHFNKPNKNETNTILPGFQLPNIIIASAKKPKPATSPVAEPFTIVNEKI